MSIQFFPHYSTSKKGTANLYKFHNDLNDTIVDSSWNICDVGEVYRVKNYMSQEWPMEFWPTLNAPTAQLFNKVLLEYKFE